MTKNQGTEKKILDAARKVFVAKGLAGARMQEIADEAGINKALLHYYFRSKDKLFQHILGEVLDTLSIKIVDTLHNDNTLFEKLRQFINMYSEILIKNPYLPMFVLNEMNQNPDGLRKFFLEKRILGEIMAFVTELMREINNGKIRPVHPIHIILNMLGMLVFPFAARPMIEPALKENIGVDYIDILEERKEVVYDFVYNALKIDDHED